MSIKTVGSLTLLASPASTSLIPVEEGGVLQSAQISSLIPGTLQLAVTVDSQPSAAANTLVFEAALAQAITAGKGELVFPKGTVWLAAGTLAAQVCLLLSGVSNITIRGQGPGITILKLRDGGDAHVISIDGSTNICISDLTVDGNRANQALAGIHGIRTGTSGCNGLKIRGVEVKECAHYGIGLQGGQKKRVTIDDCYVHDVGGDCIDIKDTADNNESIQISNTVVESWGLDLALTIQAGIDCRGPCVLTNIWATNGPADGMYIRFREGESADPSLGGHRSSLRNFVCIGNSGATSTGVYIPAHDVNVSGGYIRDVLHGVHIFGVRNVVSDVVCESCDDENFRTVVTAEDARFVACRSKDCVQDGFRIRGPGTKLIGCFAEGDLVSALTVESTATEFGATDFDCAGPVTPGSMVGVILQAANATLIGGHIAGCLHGIQAQAVRPKIIGVNSQSHTGDGLVIDTGADDAIISGCTLRGNADDGLVLRGLRAKVLGNVIRSNTSNGAEIEATAVDSYLDGNQFTSNGAALNDGGTGTRVGLLNGGLATPYLQATIKYLAGTGSPEGVHTAPVGSQYARTDGGAGSSVYIKESGTGNTGWVAK